jgi:hypothetical protein
VYLDFEIPVTLNRLFQIQSRANPLYKFSRLRVMMEISIDFVVVIKIFKMKWKIKVSLSINDISVNIRRFKL